MELLSIVAARQERAIARWQLDEIGFSRHEIDGLKKANHLHPKWRASSLWGLPT